MQFIATIMKKNDKLTGTQLGRDDTCIKAFLNLGGESRFLEREWTSQHRSLGTKQN